MKRSSLLVLFVIFIVMFTLLACNLSTLLPTKITPQKVIDSFKAAGLEAENPTRMIPDDYGIAPIADEGIHFFIPSLCSDCGGRVFYCKDINQLMNIKEYYDRLGKASALFFSWVFVSGNILVQINGDLPEEQAHKYELILIKISK